MLPLNLCALAFLRSLDDPWSPVRGDALELQERKSRIRRGRETGITANYVIRVKCRLSRELTDAFPTMTAETEPAQTVLHGHLDDQAALSGVLSHLDMLGIDILEVMQVPEPTGREPTDASKPSVNRSPRDAGHPPPGTEPS